MSDPQPVTAAAADWEAFYASYRKPGYVPGYEITSKLGGGMFGLVFRARKQSIGKDYAIKFLQVEDGEVRRAVVAELEQLQYFAQIDHPNLVSIEDRGEVDGIPYFVMSFAGTETLASRLPADGRPPAGERRAELLQCFLQACRGVAALHERSLVHFDLKPANVFLKGNVARVGDYGLSKLVTHSRGSLSMGRGTPYYMAPEMLQRRGDARSDVYSLGVMLYEILCGKVPFTGESEWEVLRKHETEPPALPSHLSASERAILQRCLAKDPAARFQSVRDLLAAFGAPAGAGAAAWTEVARVTTEVVRGAVPPPLPRVPPPPLPPPPDAYDGLRKASKEAWTHARKIANEAAKNARAIAMRAQQDARSAWREAMAKKREKQQRRLQAWTRLRGMRRLRRDRERAERRAHNGRALRTAFVFLFVTLGLASVGFLSFALLAPTVVEVRSTSSIAPPAPAAPTEPSLFVRRGVPRDLVAFVSPGQPDWVARVREDAAEAERLVRARAAQIEAVARAAQQQAERTLPQLQAQVPLPPEEQVVILQQIEQLTSEAVPEPIVVVELLQQAPESLVIAARELAKDGLGAREPDRVRRLHRFLVQATGFHGLSTESDVLAPPEELVEANRRLGALWMWFLNETAWSASTWRAFDALRRR